MRRLLAMFLLPRMVLVRGYSPVSTRTWQVCSAGSRLLVQETVYAKMVAKIKERMTHLRLGDSLDKGIDMAAIVDPSQVCGISVP